MGNFNGFPNSSAVAGVRQAYPCGTRIEIRHLDDPYSRLTAGCRGFASRVDDTGTLHCIFDEGSQLGLLYGIDAYKKVEGESRADLIKAQLSALRRLTNAPNTLDSKAVFELALQEGFDELADLIFMNMPAYSKLVLTGELADEDAETKL